VAPRLEQRTGAVLVLDLFRRAAPRRRAVRLVSGGLSRWTMFWTGAAAASLLSAFGAYTPVYPFVRDHLPLLPSLRFPAKYLVISSIVVAAGAATGWEAMARGAQGPRFTPAWFAAMGFR